MVKRKIPALLRIDPCVTSLWIFSELHMTTTHPPPPPPKRVNPLSLSNRKPYNIVISHTAAMSLYIVRKYTCIFYEDVFIEKYRVLY
jgi:hypothetical protein